MTVAKRIEISRRRSPGMVECENCDRLPIDATRERARQHADRNQHLVRVLVEDVTTYRPTGDDA
jgi:hypothetical protein